MEKEMETHSSILAWKSPWTEESGRLKSMGGGRWVGRNKVVELKKKKKKQDLKPYTLQTKKVTFLTNKLYNLL